MRAAGRMGGKRITIHNLKVLRVDPENHLLIVEGGIRRAESYVIIRKAVTLKKAEGRAGREAQEGQEVAMQLDVVNNENQKVGTVDVNDEVFGGRINGDLMWESVVHAKRRGPERTHARRPAPSSSGTGKKPWKQKGTGRAQVGSSRTPLWRHGGTVHPPRPRSYDFKLSKKVEIGALRSALAEKIKSGDVIVVDALGATAIKTKAAVEMLKRLGITARLKGQRRRVGGRRQTYDVLRARSRRRGDKHCRGAYVSHTITLGCGRWSGAKGVAWLAHQARGGLTLRIAAGPR